MSWEMINDHDSWNPGKLWLGLVWCRKKEWLDCLTRKNEGNFNESVCLALYFPFFLICLLLSSSTWPDTRQTNSFQINKVEIPPWNSHTLRRVLNACLTHMPSFPPDKVSRLVLFSWTVLVIQSLTVLRSHLHDLKNLFSVVILCFTLFFIIVTWFLSSLGIHRICDVVMVSAFLTTFPHMFLSDTFPSLLLVWTYGPMVQSSPIVRSSIRFHHNFALFCMVAIPFLSQFSSSVAHIRPGRVSCILFQMAYRHRNRADRVSASCTRIISCRSGRLYHGTIDFFLLASTSSDIADTCTQGLTIV